LERRTVLHGTPHLGVFAVCNDSILLVSPEAEEDSVRRMEDALGVEIVKVSVDGSILTGCLIGGNNHGLLTAANIQEEELEIIREHIKAERLPDTMNAVGNILLANDTAALVHPELSDKAAEKIAETLGVEVHRGTIGGIKTVGMTARATNKGVLVHPGVTREELERLEEIFDLPVDIGTVNFGSPMVGSALLANNKGYIVGRDTTGPELGRIEDALKYI